MTGVLLDPDFADAIEECLNQAIADGLADDISIVSGFRSSTEQARLYTGFLARRITGRGGLPAAKPGASYHNFGLAVDISTSPPDALEAVGRWAESCGFRWGGHFGDPVHIDAGSTISLVDARKGFVRSQLVEVA